MSERYRSGLLALDAALGGGSLPGSVLEIYGPPDTAKTALALWHARTLQAAKPAATVAWISTESPIDLVNLEWAGVDVRRFVPVSPTPSEPGLVLAREYVEKAGVDLVVIDSLAALVASRTDLSPDPDPEPGGEIQLEKLHQVLGDPERGLLPLVEAAQARGSLILLTNQERALPGSRAVYRSASNCWTLNRLVDTRIRLWPGEGIYDGAVQVGVRVHFRIVRHRAGRSEATGRFNCRWDRGLYDLRLPLQVRLPNTS